MHLERRESLCLDLRGRHDQAHAELVGGKPAGTCGKASTVPHPSSRGDSPCPPSFPRSEPDRPAAFQLAMRFGHRAGLFVA
jgi:hypothetical protein